MAFLLENKTFRKDFQVMQQVQPGDKLVYQHVVFLYYQHKNKIEYDY